MVRRYALRLKKAGNGQSYPEGVVNSRGRWVLWESHSREIALLHKTLRKEIDLKLDEIESLKKKHAEEMGNIKKLSTHIRLLSQRESEIERLKEELHDSEYECARFSSKASKYEGMIYGDTYRALREEITGLREVVTERGVGIVNRNIEIERLRYRIEKLEADNKRLNVELVKSKAVTKDQRINMLELKVRELERLND